MFVVECGCFDVEKSAGMAIIMCGGEFEWLEIVESNVKCGVG